MKEIVSNPEEYMFPNYCFTKPFQTYFFFVPRIIFYEYGLLFDFLNTLRLNFDDDNDENFDFFALGAGLAHIKRGNSPSTTHYFENVRMLASLKKIGSLFREFNAGHGWPFLDSYRIFWMAYQNKIQVYVNDDVEIVAVGVDLDENLIKIDSKIRDNIFHNFGYDGGFREYANGYGKQLLGLTNRQIAYLDKIFSGKQR